MKKQNDWEDKFDMFMLESKDKPFAWGKWDCCIFANACVKAMTGKSLIPSSLKWTDEKSAKKAIKDYGKTLRGALDKACKAKKVKQIKPYMISKGDLVIFLQNKDQVVGISDGYSIHGPTDDGLTARGNDQAKYVWRID